MLNRYTKLKEQLGGIKMDCKEILEWASKHDIKEAFWIQKEEEIGNRLRASKELTKSDLTEIIKWKFEGLEGRKKRELNLVAGINEQVLKRVSNVVFNLSTSQDRERIELLCNLDHGIGPAVASTIMSFFDPKNYGVFDFHVWQEVFNKKLNGYTVKNYIKLLSRLREIASRCGFEVRAVEKAFYAKNYARV